MVTRTVARYLSWPIDRLAALIAPTGIPPNVITWAALVFNLWAAILFAAGRFAAAGGMVILAGLCDLLDGPVARLQGRASLFGAFLAAFSILKYFRLNSVRLARSSRSTRIIFCNRSSLNQ